MKTVPARELPDPLDRVEVRAVGGKIIQTKAGVVFHAPVRMKLGVMVLRVVDDEDRSPIGGRADGLEVPHKVMECQGVEPVPFPAIHERPVPYPYGAEVSHTFSPGVVKQHGILRFRGNPHPASGSVLLEVHLVDRPQIYRLVAHHRSEFFLCAS